MTFEARYHVLFWNTDTYDWDDSQHYRKANPEHACNWAMILAGQMVREGTKHVDVMVRDSHSELEVFRVVTYSGQVDKRCTEKD